MKKRGPNLGRLLSKSGGGSALGASSMADVVLLDAGPLGMVSHPRASVEIVEWLARLVASGTEILIPEIADYEVRRELLRAGRSRGVERLNELRASFGFVPITSDSMLRAAAFWADARRRGRPTAGDQSLDADTILAGQAATLNRGEVTVASSNPRHIAKFVPARRWQDIPALRSS
jgi:predicted nucleic acid-binding protein